MDKPIKTNKKKKISEAETGVWWKYFILFAIIWMISPYIGRYLNGNEPVEISYTEFKQQVGMGKVSEVTFKGNEVSGTFETDYTTYNEAHDDSSSYSSFTTVKPVYEDPGLVTLLENNDVTVNAEPVEDSRWLSLLIAFLPWLFIIGYFVYAGRQMRNQMKGEGGLGGLFGVGKSRARKYRESKSDVRFDDVAGLQNAKRDLEEIIDYLKYPGKFKALGAEIPKGVMLMGPPGCGKTLLARASAGEAEVPFYSISGSEFIEMFVGVGASRVRDMFNNAKKEAPSIIFIDEIDSVGRARGTGIGGGHDEREQTLNQILSEMDGFDPQESVVVMAATNRPDVLDPALIRPGRFDRQITLDLPQKKARLEILKIHTRHVPLDDDVDMENLAARTVGLSGAELKNVVNEAALMAGRSNHEKVSAEDFDRARDKILLGAERDDMIMDENEKKRIACHEAGHALVAKLLPDTDPLQKVTIIPRGRALGATEQVPDKERQNLNRTFLLNRIAVTLGGRAAEKLAFNELTSGAANDLKQVTKLARRMVCQLGMSEKLGPVTFRHGEEHLFLGREMAQQKDFSEHTAQIIDEEIQRIVTDMEDKAYELLKNNHETLDLLAKELLEHETLENEDIDRILNRKSKKSA